MKSKLDPRIRRIINRIRDESLRKKILAFLSDLSVEINGERYSGLPLAEAPASRSHHHSYPGGLIEHILSTINIALALCDSVERIYGGRVDRDLVIGGVVLHDILKPLTYYEKDGGSYRNSPLGERLDHLTLLVSEMLKRNFPLSLIHIVAASHGQAGPISPKTIEALICHIADDADSKMNWEVLNAAKYLVREVTGEPWDRMDSKMAFMILAWKAEGGWEGLKSQIEEFKRKSSICK
ncbi:HDIG domain-containing protein [Candidatus Bathyarchaeota archaeon]|nr:HDIG domain-containing protein [Candidatus Bathyarchaeota archaeon]